jgi:predicted site-specific integrase-resolvase
MERMTKKETAAFFDVTPRTLERWVQQGKLPAGTRSGRKTYWPKDACEKLKAEIEDGIERGLDAQFKRWRASILNG